MVICKRVLYSGRVQGVGFRYAAQQLAHGLAVAGYVRNLPSGQVELVAEGEATVVDGFLARVAEQMAGHIRNAEVTPQPPQGLSRFVVRH
jgi:acylphosphatase